MDGGGVEVKVGNMTTQPKALRCGARTVGEIQYVCACVQSDHNNLLESDKVYSTPKVSLFRSSVGCKLTYLSESGRISPHSAGPLEMVPILTLDITMQGGREEQKC